MTVAALYVLARGPYANMPGVDPWPERRDALLYRGPHPVVAHPPCGPWSKAVARQTKLSRSQGPYLAPAAVLQVRKWGGVLEHPAESRLWNVMSLPYPEPYRQATLNGPDRDAWGGFTVALDQSAFGHDHSHKRTWCYFVGIDPAAVVLPPPAATPQMPEELREKSKTWKPKGDKRPGRRPCARSYSDCVGSQRRKRSPVDFAAWLVALASTATAAAP